MIDRSCIWRRLQELEIPPPGKVVEYLQDQILMENKKVAPEMRGAIKKLAQYKICPPYSLWDAVENLIANFNA